ncbi:MAG: nucleotide sugar dehydrogenase [Verrucomicrobiae bacterium]|nr:nucleotide sugar dehydrogenase [Verrucomicrobiae bacterium]
MENPRIAIVGLGYVGLPLTLRFAEKGVRVLGLDVDTKKIESLHSGQSYIKHIDASRIAEHFLTRKTATASADFSLVSGCEAVLICVPTPLNHNREPDLSYVFNTGAQIAPHLRKGMLVVLESTTYPGTTDTDLRAILEKGSGLKAGTDFHLAFSPEREDPGNVNFTTSQIPKIVGGLTPACRDRAVALYARAIDRVVPVSSARVAEAVKLTENIFRSVNIAMVNELKVVFEKMDIDIWEVVEGAKTKPFGYMPFYPGPGLGGHCIPIDPFYLTWKAREYGMSTRFIELAGEINTSMPDYVVQRLILALNENSRALKGSRILLLGLAYKANVDDDRESPSYVLMEKLEHLGARVDYHDPHVPVIRPSREYARYAGRRSQALSAEALRSYEAVLLCTRHDDVDYALVAREARLIVDTRNAFPKGPTVWKA